MITTTKNIPTQKSPTLKSIRLGDANVGQFLQLSGNNHGSVSVGEFDYTTRLYKKVLVISKPDDEDEVQLIGFCQDMTQDSFFLGADIHAYPIELKNIEFAVNFTF
jgi:hypothetical protein